MITLRGPPGVRLDTNGFVEESEAGDEDDSVGKVGGFGGGQDASDCAEEEGLEGWVFGEELAVGGEVYEA